MGSKKIRGCSESFKSTDDCIDYLRAHGLLYPGVTIPTEVFEKMIGRKSADQWDWRGPYLLIKEAIEREGFFTTQRGLANDDMKILAPDEVWLHSKKRQQSRKNRTDKDHKIVTKTDTSGLDEETKKRHLHEMRKLAQATIRLTEIMESDI